MEPMVIEIYNSSRKGTEEIILHSFSHPEKTVRLKLKTVLKPYDRTNIYQHHSQSSRAMEHITQGVVLGPILPAFKKIMKSLLKCEER